MNKFTSVLYVAEMYLSFQSEYFLCNIETHSTILITVMTMTPIMHTKNALPGTEINALFNNVIVLNL